MPQYTVSSFKVPVSICRAMERKIASFWWRKNNSETGLHWKKWEPLKTRKDTGGLGFRDLLSFNRATLGKQAWRLMQNNSALWSRIVKGIYFPHCSFQNAEKRTRSSWGWQSLLMGRDAISPSVMWSVGNGENILIREDKWLKRGIIGGPAISDEPRLVKGLIINEEDKWNENMIKELFDENIVSEILTIPLKTQHACDRLVWTRTKSGTFTVKSAYNRDQELHI